MEKLLKTLLIVFLVLIILVPIGLLASGTAFGEWSVEEVEQIVGYVPAGLAPLSNLWHPPIPDYSLPESPNTFIASSLGYYVSAILGVVICGGALFLVGKALTKNTPKNNG
jgi:hypothetical protein